MARQSNEILGGRNERPNRRQRLSDEDKERDEAVEEWPETRSPRTPGSRRRRFEVDDDELDPSSPSAPWLPPARR